MNVDAPETKPFTPHRVGDTLPAALGPRELQQALNITPATFYKWHRLGKFKRFEIKRAIGIKKYSGRLVQAYLDGHG
jgi:hypothetical protein